MSTHPRTRADLGRDLAAGLLLLATPVVVVIARARLGDRVPDPVATHWSGGGTADGSTALQPYTVGVLVAVAVAAAVGLGMLVGLRRRPGRAGAVAVAGWVAGLLATTYAATLLASRGATRAEDVALPWWLVVGVVVLPLVLGAVLLVVVPPGRVERPPAATPPPTDLVLAQGERATWVGGAGSRPLLGVAAVVGVTAVPLALVQLPLGLGAGLVALVLCAVHRISVRVDPTGVTVGWGLVRWPRQHFELAGLEGAEVTDIDPMAWGGWGYRVTASGRACVVRRGPGLVLRRRGQVPVAISVDDPQGAAALVNAYLHRRAVDAPM